MMIELGIKEFTSPVLDRPLSEYKIICPLHFFAFGRFKEVLLESGYEVAHPEGLFFHRPSREIIYGETVGTCARLFLTTLDFQALENLFFQAIRKEFKNKYVLIEGEESCRIQYSLSGPSFEEIKHTLPKSVVNILENSLWNYEEFCSRYSKHNLSDTLGILFYGPPGVGKTFILRSYFNKLLHERNFTVVQVYQKCLEYLNMSVLLNSCKALFPCILFLEDIDIGFKDRQERAGSLAGFLLETFEGLSQAERVVLIGTSNDVDVIEKALLRPGRIDYPLKIEKPSKSSKELALSHYLDGVDVNLPLPLRETLVNSADTFAELKGAFQHVFRTYVSTGDFPPIEDISRMIRAWRDARVVGVSEKEERRMGLL